MQGAHPTDSGRTGGEGVRTKEDMNKNTHTRRAAGPARPPIRAPWACALAHVSSKASDARSPAAGVQPARQNRSRGPARTGARRPAVNHLRENRPVAAPERGHTCWGWAEAGKGSPGGPLRRSRVHECAFHGQEPPERAARVRISPFRTASAQQDRTPESFQCSRGWATGRWRDGTCLMSRLWRLQPPGARNQP